MGSKLLCIFCFVYVSQKWVAAYDAVPRWGQATVVIYDALFVHGGKTDRFNSFSYTSAPNNNEILYLSLSSQFQTSSPPWQLVSNSPNSSTLEGPSLSWHTLSALNTSSILLFGGQPDPNSPTVLVNLADSAFLLNVFNRLEPGWAPEADTWAGQPTRRIHHSTATTASGSVLIIGGEKADGSKNGFSDHYLFNPNIPSFTTLPAPNSPPDISGHASIILSDGRLLVFGGYCQSQGTLIPFSTIWSLDTMQPSAIWTTLNVLGSSLPAPRRAFTAVLLGDGKIMIHGGSDATLQSNMADGWILDTTSIPVVWTQVDALTQLGARRDHFSVFWNNQVIFGFGFGNNGAAPASLQIYDIIKGSFTQVFNPLTESSTLTPIHTLPDPTQTSRSTTPHSTTIPGGAHSTGGAGSGGSGGGDIPGSEHSSHSNKTGIAVGTTFGVLGLLVIGALAGAYFIKQRRRIEHNRRFMVLDENEDDDEYSAHFAGNIPAAGPIYNNQEFGNRAWNFGVLNTLGLAGVMNGSRNPRCIPERRDMLADEDTRDFGTWYHERRRDGTGGSSWSLRSILTSRLGSREVSTGVARGGSPIEKDDSSPDGMALVRNGEIAHSDIGPIEQPHGRRQMSYTSTQSAQSYSDPFSDPVRTEQSHSDDEDENTETIKSKHPTFAYSLPRIFPTTTRDHPLSPVTEHASQNTLTMHDPATISSHSDYANSPFDTSSSHLTSHTSLSPLPSSIVGSSIPKNQPVKRSDTWWERFSRTSFLDRRLGEKSRLPADLHIRDPNPPPPLVPFHEEKQSLPYPGSDSSYYTSSQPSKVYGAHNKSLTSVKTTDTEAIERMAGTMDVIQRIRTGSHHASGSISSVGTLSDDLRPSSRALYSADLGSKSRGIESLAFTSDRKGGYGAHSDITTVDHLSAALNTSSSALVNGDHSRQPPTAEGAVAARIHEFERRMSLEQEIPSLTNTRKREARKSESVSVKYGLAPRPSLFVANPDHRTNSSEGS